MVFSDVTHEDFLVFFVFCFSGMEQTAPMEETTETAEQPGVSEGDPLNKYSLTEIFSF